VLWGVDPLSDDVKDRGGGGSPSVGDGKGLMLAGGEMGGEVSVAKDAAGAADVSAGTIVRMDSCEYTLSPSPSSACLGRKSIGDSSW